jgi:hypothetical protein
LPPFARGSSAAADVVARVVRPVVVRVLRPIVRYAPLVWLEVVRRPPVVANWPDVCALAGTCAPVMRSDATLDACVAPLLPEFCGGGALAAAKVLDGG